MTADDRTMGRPVISKEERSERRVKAFAERGIDYGEYCRAAELRKAERLRLKRENAERNMYRPNHEDNIQFGCCPPDVLDYSGEMGCF